MRIVIVLVVICILLGCGTEHSNLRELVLAGKYDKIQVYAKLLERGTQKTVTKKVEEFGGSSRHAVSLLKEHGTLSREWYTKCDVELGGYPTEECTDRALNGIGMVTNYLRTEAISLDDLSRYQIVDIYVKPK